MAAPVHPYNKFQNITVAVDGDRKNGIENLIKRVQPEVILLDDAYQHRRVKAGLYILLTSFGDLYCDDFLLPTGNLRESRRGAKRASIIIVTKCPPDLSAEKRLQISMRLRLKPGQELYFSYTDYENQVVGTDAKIAITAITPMDKVLVAGIAKPQPFFDFVGSETDAVLKFSDHHNFSDADIDKISKLASDKPIVTTEKDYMRLKLSSISNRLYYLPIRSTFIADGEKFDASILTFVKNSAADQ